MQMEYPMRHPWISKALDVWVAMTEIVAPPFDRTLMAHWIDPWYDSGEDSTPKRSNKWCKWNIRWDIPEFTRRLMYGSLWQKLLHFRSIEDWLLTQSAHDTKVDKIALLKGVINDANGISDETSMHSQGPSRRGEVEAITWLTLQSAHWHQWAQDLIWMWTR